MTALFETMSQDDMGQLMGDIFREALEVLRRAPLETPSAQVRLSGLAHARNTVDTGQPQGTMGPCQAWLHGGATPGDAVRRPRGPCQRCADCGAPSEETDHFCAKCWEKVCTSCVQQCLVCHKYACRTCRSLGEDCCREGTPCPKAVGNCHPHCRRAWAGPRCICTYPVLLQMYMMHRGIRKCAVCTKYNYQGMTCNTCHLWACVHCSGESEGMEFECDDCRRVTCCKCGDKAPWRFVSQCQTCHTKWCRQCQVTYKSCDDCNLPWACDMCGDATVVNQYVDCAHCQHRICKSCQGNARGCVGCQVSEGIPPLAINAEDWDPAARDAAATEDEMFRNALAGADTSKIMEILLSKMSEIIDDRFAPSLQTRYLLTGFWRLATKVDRKRKQTSQQIDPNAAYITAGGTATAVCVECRERYPVHSNNWDPRAMLRLESRILAPRSKKRSAVLCSKCAPGHQAEFLVQPGMPRVAGIRSTQKL